MARETFNDLIALLAVAREGSFTRAAATLCLSQPALSRTISTLEARLGLRLLTRSTRSVAPTEAGERLIQTVGPHFDGIEAGLSALTELREKPAGRLRINSVEHATDTILAPRWRGSCRTTRISASRSSTTTPSRTSWPSAMTRAFAWASKSPRT